MLELMSRQLRRMGVVLPAIHHGNSNVTAARRYYLDDKDGDRMRSSSKSLALALHVTEQDVEKGSTQRPSDTWPSSGSPSKQQLLQQQLRTVIDIIRKLSHDIQVRSPTSLSKYCFVGLQSIE